MSKKIVNQYDKLLAEWLHLYEGKETQEIVNLEKQLDNLWKRMSLHEREVFRAENRQRLFGAAADFIINSDGVKNHE